VEGLEEGKGAVAPASRNIRESRRRLKQVEPLLRGEFGLASVAALFFFLFLYSLLSVTSSRVATAEIGSPG
jgi:hypothetical protein